MYGALKVLEVEVYDKIPLSEKIAEEIKRMIKNEELVPGEKLPNELVLTEQLNVSRSTVREAIKKLASMNILEVKRGKGTYVASNPGVVSDPFGMDFNNNTEIVLHLFEARLIMEPDIAYLAAERRSDDEIAALIESFEEMKNEMETKGNYASSDIKFHKILANMCKNPVFEKIIPILTESIHKGVEETLPVEDNKERVLNHHKMILDCVISGDAEGAKKHMIAHIQNGIRVVNSKKNQKTPVDK